MSNEEECWRLRDWVYCWNWLRSSFTCCAFSCYISASYWFKAYISPRSFFYRNSFSDKEAILWLLYCSSLLFSTSFYALCWCKRRDIFSFSPNSWLFCLSTNYTLSSSSLSFLHLVLRRAFSYSNIEMSALSIYFILVVGSSGSWLKAVERTIGRRGCMVGYLL